MRAFLDEIIGPDMVTPAGPKPDAGTIIEPKATTLGLPCRHLQSFPPPDPCHTFGIHMPALSTEQRRDPAIAIAPKLAGKIDDRFRKRRFIVSDLSNMSLGRTRLAKNMAGSTFGNAKRLLDMMHADPTTGSA